MSRLIFFMESYTAGGSDMVARMLLEQLKADKIFLLVNSGIDDRIIFSSPFGENVSIHKYYLITPMDIGLFANRHKNRPAIYLTIKLFDYLFRYPLLVISFIYFYFFMSRFKATHFFAHNGGYPGGLYCGTALMAVAFYPGVKRFFAFHSMPRSYSKGQYIIDFLWDRILDRSSKFIAVSNRALSNLKKLRKVNQDGICIYNGIDAAEIKKYNEHTELRLLHIGYIDFNKNQIMLVKAINSLVQQGIKNLKVTFVGDINQPEAQQKINDFIRLSGIEKYFSFLGFKQDVSDYYLKNDLLICTSRIESFPMVILEAMRVGTPVIAANVGGISEQIQNGVNGYLVDVDDVGMMADRIKFFYENKKQIKLMGEASFDIFNKKFTINRMVEKYNSVLDF